ncbi:hypothetical protein ACROYT_G039222 [Oculina patagonica]
MGGRRFVYILVLLGVLIASASGEKSASPGCRVLEFGKKLQCRGVGLSRIPKIPKGILIADFTDNFITHITQKDWKHLEKLQQVYLKGNPFHCDCNLESLRLKLHNSPAVIQDGDSIQCAKPSKIHNKALKSLSNLCDIDKCKDISCEGKKKCRTYGSGIYCDCHPGFVIEGFNQQICKDINECKETPDICPRYAICTNTNGSYECNCKEGYYNTSDGCQDIDECKTTPDICSGRRVICKNTNGSYECSCEEGYSNKSGICEDIDECNTGTHNCDETTSQCQNLVGDFHCPCRTGFIKTQDKCVDIDECKQDPDVCGDKHATCKNTIGSFECICEKTGYEYNSEARNCSDTDECVDKPCGDDKNMKCKNSQGSYRCECEDHYRKDGNVCNDKVGDETEDTDIIPVAEHKSADGNVEAATSQD